MTTVELDSLSSYILSKAGSDIIAFQNDPRNELLWNKMDSSIKIAKESYTGPGSKIFTSILVTLTDGIVAYWDKGDNNSWENFLKNQILPANLNTRPAAMTALLSTNGTSYGTHFSTSTNYSVKILTKYTRTGFNSQEPLGLFLISLRPNQLI